MSAPNNNGGPAFPCADFIDRAGNTHWGFYGMSLRDYFAAAALKSGKYIYTIDQRTRTAEMCFQVADAMLAERAKEVSP